jgi:hypothetical protein
MRAIQSGAQRCAGGAVRCRQRVREHGACTEQKGTAAKLGNQASEEIWWDAEELRARIGRAKPWCILGGWPRKPFRREAGYSFHGSTSRMSFGRAITRYATSSPLTGEPAGPQITLNAVPPSSEPTSLTLVALGQGNPPALTQEAYRSRNSRV